MNRKKNLIIALSALFISTSIIGVSSFLSNPLGVFSSSGACNSHNGYHYSRKEPTKTSSGYQEFWSCCTCHESFLNKPTGTFVDRLESEMVGGLSSSHIAYLPKIEGYSTSPFDEPYLNKQVYLNSLGDIYSTWEKYRGDGVTLAVIDDGFDVDHPEFKNADGTSKILSDSAYFYSRTGGVAISTGVDKVKQNGEESHGTFCATIAAGSISGTGISGIAPNVNLLLLKVDKTPKTISSAFKYAADHGAKVITISIGSYYNYEGDLINDGSDLSTCFDEALDYAYNKGVVICSAAGNGGGTSRACEYTYPGASKHVIGCGGIAYNEDEVVWSGSSYNSSSEYTFCDIFAPSENMFAGCNYDGKKYDGGWEGTSFASPIVAGAAALYFQKYPNKTNVDFENDLYASAVSMADSKNTGHGRLDIGALLNETKTNTVNFTFNTGSSWGSDQAATVAYLWNSKTGENNSWPGVKIENGSLNIDLNKYDKMILTRRNPNNLSESWGARTISLNLYAFNYSKGYKLYDEIEWGDEGHPNVGEYLK